MYILGKRFADLPRHRLRFDYSIEHGAGLSLDPRQKAGVSSPFMTAPDAL